MQSHCICKICERSILPDHLQEHSIKCKEVAEIKQKVLGLKEKIFALVDKAHHLKNQLNTNAALQKFRRKRHESFDAAEHTFFGFNVTSPTLDTPQGKGVTKKMDLSFILSPKKEDKQSENEKDETKENREIETVRKLREFEEEFDKAMVAFKAIQSYGVYYSKYFDEMREDTTYDLKIKNEIGILYAEIRDKKISRYLRQFLDTIQEYIVLKRKCSYKTIELEEFDKNPEDQDKNQLQAMKKLRRGHRRYISVVKPIFVDEEESPLKGHSTFSHTQTENLENSIDDLEVEKSNTEETGFRRRKTAQHNPVVIHDGSLTVRDRRKLSFEGLGLCKYMPKVYKNPINGVVPIESSFIKELKAYIENIKDINFKLQIRKPPQEKRKSVDLLKKSQSVFFCPKDTECFGCDAETEINASLLDVPINSNKEEDERKEQEVLKKSNFPCRKKKRYQKSFSIEIIEKFEDIDEYVGKSLSPLLRDPSIKYTPEHIPEVESAKKVYVRNDGKKRKRRVASHFIAMSMKGYYSDTELDEIVKVELDKKNEVGIDDFEFIKMLGQGAYGKVYLVRKKTTGDKYAMKIVDFAEMTTTQNPFTNLKAERNIYKQIKGDWIVKALYTFSYQNYVCFVLEYMIGGDLGCLLEQVGCFDEHIARFYFADIVLAIESLHNLGIVHRDLKPGNLLIDEKGHLKLTDFGLSEQGINKLKRIATNRELKESSPAATRLVRQHTKEPSLQQTSQANSEQSLYDLDNGKEVLYSPPLSRFSSYIKKIGSLNKIGDSLIVRNKKDEEVIFTFLEEDRSANAVNFKLLPMKNEKISGNKKKEGFRIVGTPDYMAPEIVNGKGCNSKSVDLWSIGVILYEMLVGIPPFNDETVEQVFENITNLKMEWPEVGYGEDCITNEACSLIIGLLKLDPNERLTICQIKAHPFFEGLDWERVKEMKAPIVPLKKEENEGQKNLMKIRDIFQNKENLFSSTGVDMKEMSSFKMKRIDLLHQLNEETYKTITQKGSINSKEAI